jgi:fluoride ion exporter CrcB/FEX
MINVHRRADLKKASLSIKKHPLPTIAENMVAICAFSLKALLRALHKMTDSELKLAIIIGFLLYFAGLLDCV